LSGVLDRWPPPSIFFWAKRVGHPVAHFIKYIRPGQPAASGCGWFKLARQPPVAVAVEELGQHSCSLRSRRSCLYAKEHNGMQAIMTTASSAWVREMNRNKDVVGLSKSTQFSKRQHQGRSISEVLGKKRPRTYRGVYRAARSWGLRKGGSRTVERAVRVGQRNHHVLTPRGQIPSGLQGPACVRPGLQSASLLVAVIQWYWGSS
jgi:hypothetical protein